MENHQNLGAQTKGFGLNLKKNIKIFFSILISFSQWRRVFKILNKKEKIVLIIFIILFLSSSFFLVVNFYFKNTQIQPAKGGKYIEGLVGQPRFINPIYLANNDVDRDLVELIFSGLMKYDGNGKIVPDLVKDYEIKEDGAVFEFYLKEDVYWHDGKKFTADDVVFTIKTIQNPDYKSPLRASWLGAEVERISGLGVRFKLKNPYGGFLENLTLKIIPKHIWQDIPPENFPLAIYNLSPIGSGPYKFEKLTHDNLGRIKTLTLKINPGYYGKKPYVSEISFLFFDSEENLVKAAQNGEIQGLSLISPKSYELLKNGFRDYRISFPRYFAVFFNPQKSKVLNEKEVKLALNYGTNKEEIVEKILTGFGEVVHSPILPEIYGFLSPSKIYQFDIEKAKEVLEQVGFKENELGQREKSIQEKEAFQFKSDLKLGSQGTEVKELQKCLAKDPQVYPEGEVTGYFGAKTEAAVIKFQEKYAKEILEPWGFIEGTGLVSKTTRQKLNELCAISPEETLPLKFSLVTVNQLILAEVANLLKSQWEALGIAVEIKLVDISQLESEYIKPRNYEALLFGEILTAIPDPFPFWHSSQKRDPGLNLSLYESKEADKLLENARQTLDSESQAKDLQEFQDILIEDVPCLFLYSPDYIYLVSGKIKGVNLTMITDPSKRFSDIESWYIKTKRKWE